MSRMKEWFEKHKGKFLRKDSLLICVLTGILLLVIVWPVGEGGEMENEKEQSVLWDSRRNIMENHSLEEPSLGEDEEGRQEVQTAALMEERLEDMLSAMEGVGRVKVMITLDSLGEKVIEKDAPTTRSNVLEEDSSGGSRSSQELEAGESTVYMRTDRGEQIPYVVKEVSPQIGGVSVVCEGGGSPVVQKNITEVIQALFGIEVHKIKVVKMKQEG